MSVNPYVAAFVFVLCLNCILMLFTRKQIIAVMQQYRDMIPPFIIILVFVFLAFLIIRIDLKIFRKKK